MSGKWTKGDLRFEAAESNPSFAKVECRDGSSKSRLAASIYHERCPQHPMMRIGAPTNDREEVIANAYLAKAGRDLYEALEEASLRMESLGQDTSQQRAALASARGETA